MNLNRRDLLKSAGLGLVALAVLPLTENTAHAVANCEVGKVLSGESAFAPLPGHLHYISISVDQLRNPPAQGLTLSTTWAYGHKHKVIITQADLQTIRHGGEVEVGDTVGDHKYKISLATLKC